jgi:hypothetical protein
MVLELVFGIILSIVFYNFFLSEGNFQEIDYLEGIIIFYGILNLLFFLAVFSIGIIGAIRLKQTSKIPRAIFYSIIFWIISLVISTILLPMFFLSVYIVLIAIIVGFNIGLGVHKNS